MTTENEAKKLDIKVEAKWEATFENRGETWRTYTTSISDPEHWYLKAISLVSNDDEKKKVQEALDEMVKREIRRYFVETKLTKGWEGFEQEFEILGGIKVRTEEDLDEERLYEECENNAYFEVDLEVDRFYFDEVEVR